MNNYVTFEAFIAALRHVETGGKLGTTSSTATLGDDGVSLGPLQIQDPYFKDAVELVDKLQYSDVVHHDKAVLVMLLYLYRYDRSSFYKLQLPLSVAEKWARIHNGGPTGARKKATLSYWERVKALLTGVLA